MEIRSSEFLSYRFMVQRGVISPSPSQSKPQTILTPPRINGDTIEPDICLNASSRSNVSDFEICLPVLQGRKIYSRNEMRVLRETRFGKAKKGTVERSLAVTRAE